MTRTKHPNKKLFALLQKLGIPAKERANLAWQYSKERTTHTSELTPVEYSQLLTDLSEQDKAANAEGERMRRFIISMAHEMGWHKYDERTGKTKANMQSIDNWCVKHGKFHKKLDGHTKAELIELVSQFQEVHKSYLKTMNK